MKVSEQRCESSRTGQTRCWGYGLDQRRGPLFRKTTMVMMVGDSWGNHEAMWR